MTNFVAAPDMCRFAVGLLFVLSGPTNVIASV